MGDEVKFGKLTESLVDVAGSSGGIKQRNVVQLGGIFQERMKKEISKFV